LGIEEREEREAVLYWKGFYERAAVVFAMLFFRTWMFRFSEPSKP
jgi:hypothetical protein